MSRMLKLFMLVFLVMGINLNAKELYTFINNSPNEIFFASCSIFDDGQFRCVGDILSQGRSASWLSNKVLMVYWINTATRKSLELRDSNPKWNSRWRKFIVEQSGNITGTE